MIPDREERMAAAHRRTAATLIRCMDSRDQRGAEAIITRLARSGNGMRDVDAVMALVWLIEADRAAQRRVYRASPAWRAERRPVGVLRSAAEADALLAALVTVLGDAARAAGWLYEPADPHRADCGTYAAFRHHEDHGEPVDADCAAAARDYWRAAKRRQRARLESADAA